MADNDVHNCHACHMLTSRTCSVCGVCVFCSMDCEQRAAKVSYARIACAEHMKGLRVPENLGTLWQWILAFAQHQVKRN